MSDPSDVDDVTEALLDPSDDAAITALLAGLPEIAMPDEVADRIAAALADEEPLSGPVPAWAAGGAGNVSVLPSQRERERRSSALHTRVLGAAAAVVLVLAAVVLGSQAFHGPGRDADSATGAGGNRPSAAEAGKNGTLLTASEANYTKASLDTQVSGLLAAAEAPDAPVSSPFADDGDGGGATPPSSSPAKSIAAEDLVSNGFAVLATCVAKLDVAAGEVPVAVDAGTWSGARAVVIVLPSSKPARVDVFVVSPACGDPADPDAHLLYFASFSRH